MSIDAMRKDYGGAPLDIDDVAPDPIAFFERWFEAAQTIDPETANAMTLATIDPTGRPDARVVLLRGVDAAAGFTFYTGCSSRKGLAIATIPHAALVFYWSALDRQVRIQGSVEPAPDEVVADYWASRPRASRIAAAALPQGEEVADRAALHEAFSRTEQAYADTDIPVPAYWHGYRLLPQRIEFWQGQPSRLHDRVVCESVGDGRWRFSRLAP